MCGTEERSVAATLHIRDLRALLMGIRYTRPGGMEGSILANGQANTHYPLHIRICLHSQRDAYDGDGFGLKL